MKKILMILLCGIVATSCWEVEEYEVPTKTKYAKFMYNDISFMMSRNCELMDIAVRLNEWVAEDDEQKKEEIEDRYFVLYKIRTDGDIVRITETVNPDLPSREIKVDTKGTLFNAADAAWDIIIDDETFSTKCVGENVWDITTDGFYYNLEGTVLTYTLTDSSNENNYYSITGSGFCDRINYVSPEHSIEYKIKSKLRIKTQQPSTTYLASSRYMFCHSGEIVYAPTSLDENENARVVIAPEGACTVYYRNHSDYYRW